MAVAATMGVACGARTDLASFGEARGISGSGTLSSGSLASAGTTVPSGSVAGAGTTVSSGSFVSTGTSIAGSLAASGVLAVSGVASGSVVFPCPQTCQALGANCGIVVDNMCATTVDCGACSNGGACGAVTPNVCGPALVQMDAGAPLVLVDNQQSPTYIAVDPKNVYWTTSGNGAVLFRAPLGGGSPVAFAKGLTAFGITAEAGFVYAILTTSSNIANIMRVATSGSGAVQVPWSFDSQGPLAGPVANSTDLYWADAPSGTIWQMGLDGSDPHIIASSEEQPIALALDLKNLYWQSGQGIRMMPLNGGAVTTLGVPPPSPPTPGEALAVDSFAVYSSSFLPPCTVWRTALNGGASGPLPVGQGCIPLPSTGRGIAADGINVYLTVPVLQDPQSNTGEILRIAPTGGVATTIASGQAFPWAVTLDSNFVYWTNHGGLNGGVGQVMRAPK
jgi:hypothetical protein